MTAPLRVLMLCPSFPPGDTTCGIGDYTKCLVAELARQGDQVTVLASSGYRGAVDGTITVRPMADPTAAASRWTETAADVIHIQYAPDLYRRRSVELTPLLARARGRRTVITFHTLVDASLRSRAAVPWLLLTAAHSISANEEVTGMVRRRVPWLAHRLTEIPIGSAIPQLEPGDADRAAVRARLGVPLDARLLAFFGLVYPGKGLETLLDALATLREHDPRVHLAIVGDTRAEDQPYRAGLEALVTRLGVGPAVRWTGKQRAEDVAEILRGADVFVAPFDGGASIRRSGLITGLSLGLTIVSTTAAVPSGYVRDGENIALVPPRDPAALARRIAALLASPGDAATLAAGARRLAERLSWPSIARQTREVYRAVLAR